MTAVAPEPEAYDIERGPEPATPVGDEGTPRYTVPGDEDLAARHIQEARHHPFSVPCEDEDPETHGGGGGTSVVSLPPVATNASPAVDERPQDPARTYLPPLVSAHAESGSRSAERLAPRPSPNSLSESAPLERVPAATALSPSTTRKYKHRASIGHDARVMTERGIRVQNAVGRPKVKSLFHAMAGVRRFGDDGGEMHPKLVAVDVDAYGEEWTPREQRAVAFYFLTHAIAWLGLTFADPDSWLRKRMKTEKALSQYAEVQSEELRDANLRAASSSNLDETFWTKLVIQQIAIWLVFSLCGLAVVTRGWNEGYSRKVCHVVMYLMPFLMHLAWPRSSEAHSDETSSANAPSVWTMSWTVWFQFVPFYLQIKPARRRSTFLMLVFRAYDRAQDRPHTLSWLLTQLGGGYVVLLALYMYLQTRGAGIVPPGAERAVLIPLVVNVFGDGLAEPVGIAFGRHGYRARALFYDGKCCAGEFKRTLEGSFVVYLSALLAVLPCGGGVGGDDWRLFTDAQYAVALAALPPLMTITEAYAPHTWDNPFITLVGAAFLLGLYELVP